MDFTKRMEGSNLNNVACCPNGYKLIVGSQHINLRKDQYSFHAQCSASGEKFTKYSGGGYSVYRTDGGWVLQNGNNWTKHVGGEECCPRDGAMINFRSSTCELAKNPSCSWPEGVTAQIECA